MRPDFAAALTGLLLVALFVALGFGGGFFVAQATTPSCQPCEVVRCQAVVADVVRCEREVVVSVFVPTLRCARDELVLPGVDADGFPVAVCVNVVKERADD